MSLAPGAVRLTVPPFSFVSGWDTRLATLLYAASVTAPFGSLDFIWASSLCLPRARLCVAIVTSPVSDGRRCGGSREGVV